MKYCVRRPADAVVLVSLGSSIPHLDRGGGKDEKTSESTTCGRSSSVSSGCCHGGAQAGLTWFLRTSPRETEGGRERTLGKRDRIGEWAGDMPADAVVERLE